MKSSRDPFTGKYLFHFHTNYTDGCLTVQDYFCHGGANAYERLVFLEHIRTVPSYAVEDFVGEVEKNSRLFGIAAHIGFEARMLPDGFLDISEQHIALADVVGLAIHAFDEDVKTLCSAFTHAIDYYRKAYPDLTIVWVHPGLWFKRRNLLCDEQDVAVSMLRYAVDHQVLIEANARYRLPTVQALHKAAIRSEHIVYGLDAHLAEHLQTPCYRPLIT